VPYRKAFPVRADALERLRLLASYHSGWPGPDQPLRGAGEARLEEPTGRRE